MSIADTGKFLGNTGYTSIADTRIFWKILVIPVLQILEDSGKYWLYQYCRYWKISYEVVIENVDWSLHWIEFGDVSSDAVEAVLVCPAESVSPHELPPLFSFLPPRFTFLPSLFSKI
jgi:hypothetical protein